MDGTGPFIIDTEADKGTALDFGWLRQRGMDYIQRLCSDTWTDYNLHDPGITIMELLCYALTDLAYRTEFPIEEILCDPKGNIQIAENSFFLKDQILTSNPVTAKDYQKVLLDEVDELSNVWVEAVQSSITASAIQGLLRVTAQLKKENAKLLQTDENYGETIIRKIRECFVSHRNICEDILQEVHILKPVSIRIGADVIISSEVTPEAALAEIYRELELALNPYPRFWSEQEMRDAGYTTEEIYEGPFLKKGFLPDSELQLRKRIIDPAELIKSISQVEGVIYVKSLSIIAPGHTTAGIPYQLDQYSFASFEDDLTESPVRLFRDKYELPIQPAVFKDMWLLAKADLVRLPVTQSQIAVDSLTASHSADLPAYRSIQYLFPHMYGLTEGSLPTDETPARKGQAKQLKAYLLFFEQIITNYLAQLDHVKTMFSATVDEKHAHTYHYQPLYDVPGIRELLSAFSGDGKVHADEEWEAFKKNEVNGYMRRLGEIAEDDEGFRERMNQILDHVLARFNEQLVSYPVTLYESIYGNPSQKSRIDDVLRWKSGILQNIARFGHDRTRGFDYLRGDTGGRGGFGKRVATLLYIPPNQPFTLTKPLADYTIQPVTAESVKMFSPLSEKAAEDIKHRQQILSVCDEEEMQHMLNDNLLQRESVSLPENAWNFNRRKISFFSQGLITANYKIGPDIFSGSGQLLLLREPGDRMWQPIGKYPDQAAAIQSLKKLIAQLKEMSINSEGFYIIEHILLRPLLSTSCFGFRLYDAEQNFLLQHTHWMSFEEREKTIAELLRIAKDETGSSERELSSLCILKNNDIDYVKRQLLLYANRKFRFYPNFEMVVRAPGENCIQEDFFNSGMTVLLPSWPARFQDNNFRLFLEDSFRVHTPAHVRVSFQWLSIQNMKEFENLYANWVGALRNVDEPTERRFWSGQVMSFLNRK